MLAVVDDARVRAGDGHAAWSESFNEMFAQVAGVFGNAAVRRHGRAYLLGLLSHAERKNSWSLAEFAGDVSPDGMQRLLNFSPWDEDGVPGRRAPATWCGTWAIPAAVLAVDETGFLKKGTRSAGVASGSTRAPPGGSRTASSACSSPMPRRRAGRLSTGSCTCRRNGRRPGPLPGGGDRR